MNEHAAVEEPAIIQGYRWALRYVEHAGYGHEISWQKSRNLLKVTEPDFLREAAWVVLNSGMREAVIRQLFPQICKAYFGFKSARLICERQAMCMQRAMEVFGHLGKQSAIVSIAATVNSLGEDGLRQTLLGKGVDFLEGLPWMGPATSRHLAKNLGVQTAKPDRHLVRIAEVSGLGSVDRLCEMIARYTQDDVAVVDLVLWRFATLRNDYLHLFSQARSTKSGAGRAAA